MAENILNENLEEVIETPVEETTEETVVDETTVDDELIDKEMMVMPEEEPVDEEMMVVPEEMPPQRVNPFCVVSKKTFGEYDVRDIQTNGAWGANPYGDDYAVVPDDMVPAIMETRGFCDIELNEDGTEIVSFTALEIPEIPVPEPEPTVEDRVTELEATNAVLEEQIAVTELTMIENYEAQEEINAQTENALIEIYEMMEG